jgi:hypothetical protein
MTVQGDGEIIHLRSTFRIKIADSALASLRARDIVPRSDSMERERWRKGMEPMTARWGICACLALVLALAAGCRTPQPVLKPPPEDEKLNAPPALTKYSTTGLPDQAFDKPADPGKAALDAKLPGARGGGAGMMTPGAMGQGNH